MKSITNKMLKKVSEVLKRTKVNTCFVNLGFYNNVVTGYTNSKYTIHLKGCLPEVYCETFSGDTFEEAFKKLTDWVETRKES